MAGVASLATDSEMVMSSTYIQCLDLRGQFLARSFNMIRKSIGPNFVPWGTPATIGAQSDVDPPTLTDWVRPERKLQIHGIS